MVIGAATLSTTIFKSLLIVLATILLDFIFGVLLSIKKKTFDPRLLPKFIAVNVFPYVGGLVVLALLSVYLAGLDKDAAVYCYGFYYTTAGMAALKFSKEALLDKIKELFS